MIYFVGFHWFYTNYKFKIKENPLSTYSNYIGREPLLLIVFLFTPYHTIATTNTTTIRWHLQRHAQATNEPLAAYMWFEKCVACVFVRRECHANLVRIHRNSTRIAVNCRTRVTHSISVFAILFQKSAKIASFFLLFSFDRCRKATLLEIKLQSEERILFIYWI